MGAANTLIANMTVKKSGAIRRALLKQVFSRLSTNQDGYKRNQKQALAHGRSESLDQADSFLPSFLPSFSVI
jgi:hypothetical protein